LRAARAKAQREAKLAAEQGAAQPHAPPPAPPPAPPLAPQQAPPQPAIAPAVGSAANDGGSDGGVIFGCKNETFDECMTKKLLGLPAQHLPMVQKIVPFHTALFLFNYTKRTLHGVFEATEPGALNLDDEAWTSDRTTKLPPRSGLKYTMTNQRVGGGGSPFPAQVRFQVVHSFPPLPESKFKHIVTYKAPNQFEFLLTADQVTHIMTAFIEQQGTNRARAR